LRLAPPYLLHHAPTIYITTLSLHDALPICRSVKTPTEKAGHEKCHSLPESKNYPDHQSASPADHFSRLGCRRSQSAVRYCSYRQIGKHTSELQSPDHLVCRLLLEKKNI